MTATTPPSRTRHRSLARRIVDRPEVGAAIGLAAVWIFFAITGGGSGFLTPQGITSYLAVSTQVGQERKRLAVRLLTPEGAVYDDVAYMVIAPSIQGEVGILPRHTPFIAFLKMGETRIKLLDDTEVVFATSEGYLSVEEDQVLLLVEQAERADEIDRERAQAALQAAEEAIAAAGEDDVARVAAETPKALERGKG